MSKQTPTIAPPVEVRFAIDSATHAVVTEWADSENRTARQHVAALLKKLAALRKDQPDELRRLGLLDGLLVAH